MLNGRLGVQILVVEPKDGHFLDRTGPTSSFVGAAGIFPLACHDMIG